MKNLTTIAIAWISIFLFAGCGDEDGSGKGVLESNDEDDLGKGVLESNDEDDLGKGVLESNRAVDGSVFIVTKGGSNIKLGLVSVYAIKRSDYDQHIQTAGNAQNGA